jgi:hypothetical protein
MNCTATHLTAQAINDPAIPRWVGGRVKVAGAGCLLPCFDGQFVVRYQFMGVLGSADMTREKFGPTFLSDRWVFTKFLLCGCWWLIYLSMVDVMKHGSQRIGPTASF